MTRICRCLPGGMLPYSVDSVEFLVEGGMTDEEKSPFLVSHGTGSKHVIIFLRQSEHTAGDDSATSTDRSANRSGNPKADANAGLISHRRAHAAVRGRAEAYCTERHHQVWRPRPGIQPHP